MASITSSRNGYTLKNGKKNCVFLPYRREKQDIVKNKQFFLKAEFCVSQAAIIGA